MQRQSFNFLNFILFMLKLFKKCFFPNRFSHVYPSKDAKYSTKCFFIIKILSFTRISHAQKMLCVWIKGFSMWTV